MRNVADLLTNDEMHHHLQNSKWRQGLRYNESFLFVVVFLVVVTETANSPQLWLRLVYFE